MADEKKYVSNDNLLYVWQKIKNLLSGKVDKIDGKGLSTNDYTSTEKTKLANIASNAQVNVLEGIQVNGSTVTPTNKIANIDLSSYAKKSDITSVYKLKGNTTWSALIALTTAEVGDVYNVTDKGGANYVCIKAKTAGASSWDKLGDTVDLSGYYTSSQVDTKISTVEAKIPTGAAASKGVVTTIDTSANLPTSNAVKTFVEGKNYLTGITSSQVTSALGFTPYNSTNPNGYITSSGSITGNAATATKATQDGSGNNIVNTYATKTALSTVEGKIPTNYVTTNTSQTITGNKSFSNGVSFSDGTYSQWGFLLDNSSNSLVLRNNLSMLGNFQSFSFNQDGKITYKNESGTIKTFATLDDIGANIEELTNAEIDTIFNS